jgi:2-polyprenyl-6-methoxyphenol hydroxylase-like FAD-dependent oxidoreductase
MLDVVISGAGPNGLLLATELALAGVRPLVLEKLTEPTRTPKANGMVGRVVQALHHRGLYQRITGHDRPPVPVPHFQFGSLPLDMSTLDGRHSLFALPIPQRALEELLGDRARELGVTVRRGVEVTGFRQDADSVTVDLTGPDGPEQLVTRYLVGADGGRSTVRKLAGIDFPGITDNGFVSRNGQVAIPPPYAVGNGELDVPGVGRLRPASFRRTETGVFAYGMFQPGVYRVSAIEWGQDDAVATEQLPVAELRAAVGRVLGADLPMTPVPGSTDPVGRAAVGVNSRIADRYRDGRVFLVGDAAHVHLGVGGPGLNLGLQDAINLGWKLAGAVRGWAPADLLDTYQSERRPVGERVITQSRAQAALLEPGPNVTALRQVFGELLRDQAAVSRLSDLMSGADTRYDMRAAGTPHPLTGTWVPDLTFADGTPLASLLHTACPILLLLTDSTADLAETAAPWQARVDVVSARVAEPPADALLIRPDGYLAWVATGADDPAALRHALRTWFGDPDDSPC